MTLETRAESSSLGLCLARRNCNKIELFLNLLANIRIIPELSLYLQIKFAKTGFTSAKSELSALGLHCF